MPPCHVICPDVQSAIPNHMSSHSRASDGKTQNTQKPRSFSQRVLPPIADCRIFHYADDRYEHRQHHAPTKSRSRTPRTNTIAPQQNPQNSVPERQNPKRNNSKTLRQHDFHSRTNELRKRTISLRKPAHRNAKRRSERRKTYTRASRLLTGSDDAATSWIGGESRSGIGMRREVEDATGRSSPPVHLHRLPPWLLFFGCRSLRPASAQ